ncbi:hypothetical protein ACH4GG_27255 [Streptomyces albidoflavus]|uniref:hypothetical protein n=1 Tax=Streptomyces albidoflavus TaxID=1886 RepID=UPI000A3E528D|nr:hypothetical protein [Streptomyces albidoflavus]RZE18403.1 hypothetical protein C0Q96_28915 [Streptomyces albidoflavus]
MRTRTTTGILAVLALALTACGSSDDPADAKPSPSATVSKGERYLATAQEITFNGEPSDAELQALPPLWCDALDDGHSVQWMFDTEGGLYPIGEDWGTVKADAYKLLIAGVRTHCPEHLSAVQGELRETGEY